jgi:rubrerythrin
MRIILGVPRKPQAPPRKPTRAERLLREEADREEAKTKALRDIEYASRTCPKCGYPCADWLKACGVCGRKISRRRLISGERAN